MLVVDTSVLVARLRGDEAATHLLARESRQHRVLAPALVTWELWKGADTPKRRADVETLLADLDTDPLTLAIARLAREAHAEHRRKGVERPPGIT